MDQIALALKMKRLAAWLDPRCEPDSLVCRQFDEPPFGQCYVTIDPERQGPFASINMNRVHLCGDESGLTSQGIVRLIELFASKNVERFFVWLSPGPRMGAVRDWLETEGLTRIRRTGYPTLWRRDGSPVAFKTDLDVREVGVDEIDAARDQLGDMLWPGYLRSVGKENFFHYMAFDGSRPVAIAALCVFEDIGYLMAAATAERDRKRGAQQALIARRIARAEQLGCSVQVSETLYMLEHSLRNLQRAGFEQAYEKEVFEWNV
jgi:GNAT superfamily N-acetyltransferase